MAKKKNNSEESDGVEASVGKGVGEVIVSRRWQFESCDIKHSFYGAVEGVRRSWWWRCSSKSASSNIR